MRLHYAIVLNPTADKGAAAKRITEIKKLMERDKMDFRIHQTERPGHAIELRKTLSRNADTAIIAAGGDGTCNEIINGLLASHRKRDKPLIGVLPIGRNNDFACGVGLPEGLEASMDTLLANQITPLDVGWISGGDYPKGRWFGNGLGVCFNAATIANIHNATAYPLAAIKTLVKHPVASLVELSVDGKASNISPALISAMNGKRLGDSYHIAPHGQGATGAIQKESTAISLLTQSRRGMFNLSKRLQTI